MRTKASTPARHHPHLGIPGLAWDQSNPNPGSRVVLPLLIAAPLGGAVGHPGVQTGTGAVHQSVGVAVADHLVRTVAHMYRPAGEGEHPGVGVTPVKAAGVARGLLILGMVQAFQGTPEAGI